MKQLIVNTGAHSEPKSTNYLFVISRGHATSNNTSPIILVIPEKYLFKFVLIFEPRINIRKYLFPDADIKSVYPILMQIHELLSLLFIFMLLL